MSTQVRFVPIVCDGHSASATTGSRTTSRILERANSCAVRFASASVNRSVNALDSALMPPRRQPVSYAARRSSGVASSAARSGGAMGTPASLSRARRRRSS